jgi:hypothetical protein
MVRQYPWPFRAALLISFGLYLAACALPATDQWVTHDSSVSNPRMGTRTESPATEQQGSEYYETMQGLTCLLYGWLNLIGGSVAWLANPLAFVGAVLLILRRPAGAAAFGAASLIVALLYALVPPGGPGHRDVPRAGAWLWLGSFFALTCAAMIRRGRSLPRKHAEPDGAPDTGRDAR